MAFVYILQGENEKYYIGSTTDKKRRLLQHQTGHTWTTQRLKNFKMVFSQEYPTLQEARKIEMKLKRLKRKDYIDKIVRDGHIRMTID